MTKEKDIKQLIDRFWEADTKAEEELRLFNDEWTASDDQAFELYRGFIREQRDAKLDDAFDQDVLQSMSVDVKQKNTGRIIRMARWWQAAAAAILLVCVAYVMWPTNSPSTDQLLAQDTYTDEMEAYEQVKSALMLISNNMNEGMSHTMHLKEFHNTKDKLISSNK